jgi:hypothetical protein
MRRPLAQMRPERENGFIHSQGIIGKLRAEQEDSLAELAWRKVILQTKLAHLPTPWVIVQQTSSTVR